MKLNFYLYVLILSSGFQALAADAEKKMDAATHVQTNQAELKHDAQKNKLKDELVRDEIFKAIPELHAVLGPVITQYLFNIVTFNEIPVPDHSFIKEFQNAAIQGIFLDPRMGLTQQAEIELFLKAATNGDYEKMKQMIEEDENIVYALDGNGNSAYDLALHGRQQNGMYYWDADVRKPTHYSSCLALLWKYGVGRYRGEIETEDGIIKICYEF